MKTHKLETYTSNGTAKHYNSWNLIPLFVLKKKEILVFKRWYYETHGIMRHQINSLEIAQYT